MNDRFTLLLLLSVCGAGTTHAELFKNLDFELARTNAVEVTLPSELLIGTGSAEDLLPFWQVNIGSVELEIMGVNTFRSFVTQPLDLLTERDFVPATGNSVRAVGPDPDIGWRESIFFIQRAEIPENAIRLSYDFYLWTLGVLVNGESLFAVEVPSIANLNFNVPMTADYDISMYAGQTVELALFTQGRITYFDNIRFSDVPFIIPEPSVFALGTFAGLLWFLAKAGSIRRRPTTGSRIKTGV